MVAVLKSIPWIRKMTADDLSEVMTIETASYPFPWTSGIFTDCMRVDYFCKVLGYQNNVHGYAIYSSGVEECHVLNICIGQENRGQGWGRWLMMHILEHVAELDVKDVYLEVRPSNQTAINLYLSLGFEQVGVRKGYYPTATGREDALVLSKPV